MPLEGGGTRPDFQHADLHPAWDDEIMDVLREACSTPPRHTQAMLSPEDYRAAWADALRQILTCIEYHPDGWRALRAYVDHLSDYYHRRNSKFDPRLSAEGAHGERSYNAGVAWAFETLARNVLAPEYLSARLKDLTTNDIRRTHDARTDNRARQARRSDGGGDSEAA